MWVKRTCGWYRGQWFERLGAGPHHRHDGAIVRHQDSIVVWVKRSAERCPLLALSRQQRAEHRSNARHKAKIEIAPISMSDGARAPNTTPVRRIGAQAFVTIASGMLVGRPTKTPDAIGDIGSLTTVKRPTSDPRARSFQRVDDGPASSYAARSHAVSCRSTCAGAVSRTSTCQRFGDMCWRFSTRGLRISLPDFNVSTSDERRVAIPANAVCRTKWIEVFFVSSATGPNVRATSTTHRYVANTDGSFVATCDVTLMQPACR